MTTLRVATFQRRPLFDDITSTVERLLADLAWCDEQSVRLAIFPECYMQGYASDRDTIMRRALSLDSRVFAAILAQLARFQTAIVLGLIEKRDTAFYNTAVVIRCGSVVGTYVKCHPNERGFDAGDTYPVFEVSDWPFGINICNDANYPNAALNISRQGARLLCYPLNNMLSPATATQWRQRSIENLQQRAVETGCWVVSSDVVGTNRDKMSYGCTCIVRPDGVVVQRAAEGVEEVVMFDLH